jgi:arginyl-tRNA synthetase
VITVWLRRNILAAAGTDQDPLLRPAGGPGSYASSLPFRLAAPGQDPREIARALAASLATEPWIAAATATGPGYLTVTVTRAALAALAVQIPRAGEAAAASDALRGRTVPAAPEAHLAAEPSWTEARSALAAELTAQLAATAGATLIFSAERSVAPPPNPLPSSRAEPERPVVSPFPSPSPARAEPEHPVVPHPKPPLPVEPEPPAAQSPASLSPPRPGPGPVAAAISYAGYDAVRFALARMPPDGPSPEAAVIARYTLTNPAYAVRYAHAAAAAVLRWAATLGRQPAEPGDFQPRLLARPEELALLDALSWLPERVAMAARRGRPDDFAGYTEELAARTVDTMSTPGFTHISSINSERLWLATAARTGLAASLGLLGISAPERL